jgi:hypothetical protein
VTEQQQLISESEFSVCVLGRWSCNGMYALFLTPPILAHSCS